MDQAKNGTQVAVLIALVVGLGSVTACEQETAQEDDSGVACPSWEGRACEEAGIDAAQPAAFCDECGWDWVCYWMGSDADEEYQLTHTGVPCECIIDGYVRVQDYDDVDVPSQCANAD